MKNVFIGNLDLGTTEDQVRTLFEPYGTVETVTVVRDRDTGYSRGFAFVELAIDSEAEAAIKALNGALLGERRLNVNEARPKRERGAKLVERREHPREALETRKHRQHRF